MNGLEMPKRAGPPDVKPVQIGTMRFEAVHWGRDRGMGQNGGMIAAVDVKTGKEQWVLKVYQIDYDPQEESDVQDIFIKSLEATPDGRHLLVKDERGRSFEVNITERRVRSLP